ncbi:MAG: tRNA dihydrouridine(20/20a) synthase DusA [Thalassobaculales bacterium]
MNTPEPIFAVAPMMDWTDRHCRFFHRQLSRRARLYTEMVTAQAVLRGDRARLLGFDPAEHPVALQLGGSDPAMLAEAAAIGQSFGYDEVNLNCGCPSDRVTVGRFGACLMREPATVAACVAAMIRAVSVPVTVKCRIGVDEADGYDDLRRFVEPVAAAGCRVFVVHARKAWLNGLSPKENREIPPLRPQEAYRLKAEFPDLAIILNGGIRDLATVRAHLAHVDGVMLGRAAYEMPWLLAGVDPALFGAPARQADPWAVVAAMEPYIAARLAEGVPLSAITRHMLGLFGGLPGARAWRRHLAENAHRPGAGVETLRRAAALVRPALARAA